VKRGAADSDDGSSSKQDGPQVNLGRGTKWARSPRPSGKRRCQMGKEGGTGSHIRARSVDPFSYSHHGRDGSAPEEASGPRIAP
jgi:hypothetical protein